MDTAMPPRPTFLPIPFEFLFASSHSSTRPTASPIGGQAIQVVGLQQVNLVNNTPKYSAGDPSLMDGGANICLTGNLNSLIDTTPIVPFPISVATKGSKPTLGDLCTMQGLLPLPLANRTYYN
jgi:hypothetical protein